jgi:hypothetical protein
MSIGAHWDCPRLLSGRSTIRLAAVCGLGILSACTSAPHPQSTDEAYQACLARARSNDLVTRDNGATSLRGFPSERRRDDMDALPAFRSQSPLDQCNDLRARGRL